LLWWFGADINYALNDAIVSASCVTLSCFIMGNGLQYYLPQKARYLYIIMWGLCLTIISLTITRYSLQYLIDDKEFIRLYDYTVPLRFCLSALVIAWMATMTILWSLQQNQKENEQRKADAERLAREAELYNLRQQLQPHFLFNSLNSIIALIGRKPEEARNMTFQLSDFLRGTLRKDDQQLISLHDELEHLQLYLQIEKVRFGHRLETNVTYDDACKDMLLPAMILQPLVENAIKFGLYDTTGAVSICIRATCTHRLLEVSVQNPFDTENNTPRTGTGFGIRGVQRRLFLLFGRTDLLRTSASANIFTSTIHIPQP
jgi:two-component system LytT family sensor kinase